MPGFLPGNRKFLGSPSLYPMASPQPSPVGQFLMCSRALGLAGTQTWFCPGGILSPSASARAGLPLGSFGAVCSRSSPHKTDKIRYPSHEQLLALLPLPELCSQLPSAPIAPAPKTIFSRNFTVIHWEHNEFFLVNKLVSLTMVVTCLLCFRDK